MIFTKEQYKEAADQLHDEMGMDAFIKFCQLNSEMIEEAIKTMVDQ